VLVAHPDISAELVRDLVREDWAVDASTAEHAELPGSGWHWLVGDEQGPQWFATLDVLETPEDRRSRLASFEHAAALSQRLSFVVAPVHTRDARVAVDIGPGLLLSLAPYLDGTAVGAGPFATDVARADAASMMGDLHRCARSDRLPVWRPGVGRPGAGRPEIEALLRREDWAGGPWSGLLGTLLTEARPAVGTALRRHALLAAAVVGNIERWVVSHGRVDTTHLVRTLDGPRLVGWSGLAVAPRERDLRELLGSGEGDEAWYAYLASGGSPQPLSPDTVELFDLEQSLSRVAEDAVRLASAMQDTPDERLRFGRLEEELGGLRSVWG
jgi:hypothetical protein